MPPRGPALRRRARHGRVHQLDELADAGDGQMPDRVDRQERRHSSLLEPRLNRRRDRHLQVVGHERSRAQREWRRIQRVSCARAVQDALQHQEQEACHYSH